MAEKVPEEKKEIAKVREVADNFRALIQMKQSEYDALDIDYDLKDLLKGTLYEKRVAIQDDLIEIYSTYGTYQWIYTQRVGKTSGSLTENMGF